MKDEFMQLAIDEALQGLKEGGIPIGSVLTRHGKLIAKGHNKRVQEKNPILHGEMDCLNNAGRIGSYKDTVIYSTLMPCYMCAGTIVQFKIKKVIVGESKTFSGAREFMESHGVEVVDLNLPECVEMMENFIEKNPELWNEDIGE
jgi:cytosine/creatinine deaminase